MQSLAPALTLTLTLTLTFNHLANRPQQTTNTLFGLMYAVKRIDYEYSTRMNRCETNYLWIFNRRRNDDVMQHEQLWKKRIPFTLAARSYALLIQYVAKPATLHLENTVEPRYSKIRTPCFNGRFAQVQTAFH